jgi:aminoglycoside 6'-N-acetyltransferase I
MIEVSLRNVVDGCLTSPVGYIEGVYIDPTQRGAGLSRRLLQYAEEWCRSMGCTEIATDAEFENEEAQRFHEHMGFEETYRIVEYRKKL